MKLKIQSDGTISGYFTMNIENFYKSKGQLKTAWFSQQIIRSASAANKKTNKVLDKLSSVHKTTPEQFSKEIEKNKNVIKNIKVDSEKYINTLGKSSFNRLLTILLKCGCLDNSNISAANEIINMNKKNEEDDSDSSRTKLIAMINNNQSKEAVAQRQMIHESIERTKRSIYNSLYFPFNFVTKLERFFR